MTVTPVVGMGATILMYTDRHPATVVEVVNVRKIIIQEDKATRIDENGMSDSQTYTYEPDATSPRRTFTLRKNGYWIEEGDNMKNGQHIALGHRRKYYDFGF